MSKDRPDPLERIRFSPDRRGLEAWMGPLEAEIMDLVWRAQGATVREIWQALGGQDRAAYTTVMTTLQRLFEKGYLDREPAGRAHRYLPRKTRQEFQQGVLARLVQGFLGQLRGEQRLGFLGQLSERERLEFQDLLARAQAEESSEDPDA